MAAALKDITLDEWNAYEDWFYLRTHNSSEPEYVPGPKKPTGQPPHDGFKYVWYNNEWRRAKTLVLP